MALAPALANVHAQAVADDTHNVVGTNPIRNIGRAKKRERAVVSLAVAAPNVAA
jgi:hypothetical protein